MKLLTNPASISSSPSSSSSTIFSGNNIFDSKSATATSCLAGIFRGILCSRSLPTHPSDRLNESCFQVLSGENPGSSSEPGKEKVDEEKVIMPSLVAKLMGLDYLPNTITRSRSMNSLDTKGKSGNFDCNHGRLKSTSSFREMPTFIELETEEFFELRFEYGDEGQERKSRGRKCEMGFGELKKKKEGSEMEEKTEEKESGNCVNVGNSACEDEGKWAGLEIKGGSESRSPTREVSEVVKLGKRKKKKKKKKRKKKEKSGVKGLENECSSEESSPVSVLDFVQFASDRDFPTSVTEINLNSRRKLSPERDLDPDHRSCSRGNDNNLTSSSNESANKTGKGRFFPCIGSWQKDYQNEEEYLEMWEQVFEMNEAEIIKSNWICRRKKMEDFEDICEEFGSEILDQLLDGLVHQLIGLPMDT